LSQSQTNIWQYDKMFRKQETEKQDREWRHYLLKYKNKFKVKKNTDGCYNLACYKNNMVFLCSLDNKLLAYHFQSGKTGRAKNLLRKKLQQNNTWYDEISQEGDTEIILLFKESDLSLVASIFKIRKRRVLKPEYRKVLIERLQKWHKAKNHT